MNIAKKVQYRIKSSNIGMETAMILLLPFPIISYHRIASHHITSQIISQSQRAKHAQYIPRGVAAQYTHLRPRRDISNLNHSSQVQIQVQTFTPAAQQSPSQDHSHTRDQPRQQPNRHHVPHQSSDPDAQDQRASTESYTQRRTP